MQVYVDDPDPVEVELLSLDKARSVFARCEAELPGAFNTAHADSLLAEMAEVADHIAWLESQAAQAVLADAAAEARYDLWADRGLGIVN